MSTIPSGPSDVTAAWITSVTDWTVDSIELTDIGTGLGVSSAVYRAVLTGQDCPSSVVVKLTAADPAAAFTSTVLHMYRREVKFFELLAHHSPMRVPAGYYWTVSDDGARVAVIMEDLGGNRPCDQIAGIDLADAERCIDAIAEWHARWWRDVDGLTEQYAALALGNDLYPAILPGLFAEGWEKLMATPQCRPPDNVLEVGPRFGDLLAGLLQQLDQDPVTLLHGDFRGDNLLFAADGSPIAIDFQLIHTGSAAYDLAYFITQTLDADDARAHEEALLDRWRRRVVEAGVDTADLDRIDDDYTAAALFCLVYPVVASRGMDLDDPRQADLVSVMMSRMSRALADRPASLR